MLNEEYGMWVALQIKCEPLILFSKKNNDAKKIECYFLVRVIVMNWVIYYGPHAIVFLKL
jgi:hypothetical protein